MKYLRVTMPDGSRWDVPAEVIARHRASYYMKQADKAIDVTFKREYEFAMNDAYELQDWAENNMNWSDVQSVAKEAPRLKSEPVCFQEGWVNGDKEIIELP